MSLWSLPRWEDCSESSSCLGSSSTPRRKGIDDAEAPDSRSWTQPTRLDDSSKLARQPLPLCTELHRIHERFESLRLQLDAERRATQPQQQLWHPHRSRELQRPPDAFSSPAETPLSKNRYHDNTFESSLLAKASAFSSAEAFEEKAATATPTHVANAPQMKASSHPVVVDRGTNTDGEGPPLGSLVKEHVTQTLSDYHDVWQDKINTLDRMVTTLSFQIQDQTDAAALTMYVAWLATTIQSVTAALPLPMERPPHKGTVATWRDISKGLSPRLKPPKVPAHFVDATASIESSLATLVQWCRASHDSHTSAMHQLKQSLARKHQKAAHDASAVYAKWEEALATVHSLQDERNALQTQLHGQVQRTAAVEKDLLLAQVKATTLEQQCRDLQDQLRLQELAWKEELAKADTSPLLGHSPPTHVVHSTTDHSDASKSHKVVPIHQPPTDAASMDDRVKAGETDEWWKDDETSCSCVDDERQPVPRILRLPPPVPPVPVITPRVTPQPPHPVVHQDSHTRMLLQYLDKASSLPRGTRRTHHDRDAVCVSHGAGPGRSDSTWFHHTSTKQTLS